MSKKTPKDKLLFWIDLWFFHYGIAKSLQEKYDYEVSAIIDVDNKAKKFFLNQDLVKFENIWYFMDIFTETPKEPDLKYLSDFEEKYQINIWNVAYSDKYFHSQFNPHYTFTHNEVLHILEQECKFFEKILDTAKPDFLCLLLTGTHQSNLLYQICKAKKIKILMLLPTKFRHRFLISEEEYGVDKVGYDNTDLTITWTDKEIEDYWKSHDLLKQVKEFEKAHFQSKKWNRYESILKFFLDFSSNSYKKRFSNYGRSKSTILSEKISRYFKRRSRSKFLNQKLIKKIDASNPFVYYPLHYEPERITLTAGRFFPEQIAVIEIIAKSIPVGYKLYVKDHPMMGTIGWRDISYYKRIMDIPNVELLHPRITHEEIMKKCSLVVTIAGTAGLEAAFYLKPSIVLGDVGYSVPSVFKIENIEDLPSVIRTSINKTVNLSDLNEHLQIVDQNSFVINFQEIAADFSYRFGLKGPVMDADLRIPEIKSFLKDHQSSFEKLALEHNRKIIQHKNYKTKNQEKTSNKTN